MEVKIVSSLSQAIVEVEIGYADMVRVTVPFHYIVTFSEAERRVIEKAFFCKNRRSYEWWETRYKNIVFSKVRRSIDLDLNGCNRKRIASIKLL